MDQTHAANTRRIAKNTAMLYVRMLFSMLVSFYTSRVILQALGVEDYGIYNVVGGLVAMFALISSALTSSIGRFLAFELGSGNKERLRQVFATSIIIQSALSIIIIIAAETLGLWFLNTQMVIPPDRIYAANWVFQASIIAFVFGLLSCPYIATITAHERMDAFAYIGILSTLLKLAIVLVVAYANLPFDRLIFYSILTVFEGILTQMIYVTYCNRHFEECHGKIRFNKSCWKEMSGFAMWNAIGCTAGLLKEQGVNVLLNLFFGPIANAARGVSGSLLSVMTTFSANFMAALNPQITKSYASGDIGYTFSLVQRGSRFAFYIMMALAIPILLETPCILTLWLKQYPEYTVTFTRLVIIVSLIDILSNTLITLQNATGRIRNYQIAVGGMLMMNFPVTYLLFKLGFAPHWAYIVAIGVAAACLILRLIFLRSMVGLNIRNYLRTVCLNVLIVGILSAILPTVTHHFMAEGFLRLVCVTASSVVGCCISILYVGCTASERQFILDKAISMWLKLRTHTSTTHT